MNNKVELFHQHVWHHHQHKTDSEADSAEVAVLTALLLVSYKKTRVESGMLKVMTTFVGNYRCLRKQHIIQLTTLNI